MSKIFVTGGAGFVGSHLVNRLIASGHNVRVYDKRVLPTFGNAGHLQGDLLDAPALTRAMRSYEMVYHLAANADVRHGPDYSMRDTEQNLVATQNVLEAMRANDIHAIAFTSSASVYGEPKVFPTPEDAPMPVQTSLYGASKLAAEALIQAYGAAFGIQAWIFRLCGILGERYSHGHVLDFFRQLHEHPTRLVVQGDGNQIKSYLYVQDCIDAMLLAVEMAQADVNIFNVSHSETCTVKDSVRWITDQLDLTPTVEFTGGKRGWIGDSPRIQPNNQKMRLLGWRPNLTIQQAIEQTVHYLTERTWANSTAK